MADPLLQVLDLFCERDDRVLFDGLCFSVFPGEILQVEGQNGSGKTTLLRILSGLSRHYEGDILWRGESVSTQVEAFRRQLLYFGHQAGVKAILTPDIQSMSAHGEKIRKANETHINPFAAAIIHEPNLYGAHDG